MNANTLTINKLEGYSGIRLRDGKKLVFEPGINLMVGRNGCGKTNLIRLIQHLSLEKDDLRDRIESSFVQEHLRRSLEKKGGTVYKQFGLLTIVEHVLKGKKGNISLSIKNVADFVAENIIRDGNSVHHNIDINLNSVGADFRRINSNQSPPKFEMTGFISPSFLSREPDNQLHVIMEGPIKLVSDFIWKKMIELYESDEFNSRMKALEESINMTFQRFLGMTSKEIKINYSDLGRTGRVSLSLMDGGNYIQSAAVSTGEAILLNLVFQLAIVKADGCDILALDEPDSHMHDDMLSVLVSELLEVQRARPNCIIIVATHSTPFIEMLATIGADVTHVITFDSDRGVGNSNADIDLIKALHRNGVTFSPLMLSKRRNIFIENHLETGRRHRDYFLKFFDGADMPYIIPLGTSGNVKDAESFTGIFKDILNVAKLNSVGIQDGDIWFKSYLKDYLEGKTSLQQIVQTLKEHKGAYIEGNSLNAFYFNFWEIENLYLMDELLPCWTRGGETLNKAEYRKVLNGNTELIASEYFRTFFKTVSRVRVEQKEIAGMVAGIDRKHSEMKRTFSSIDDLKDKVNALIRSMLRSGLTRWMPGKEIKRCLEANGYVFRDANFDFTSAKISKQIRAI